MPITQLARVCTSNSATPALQRDMLRSSHLQQRGAVIKDALVVAVVRHANEH